MKLQMNTQMRLEQRMKLAPRMIQSMEILQLPILALQERIEQELNNNPVLEVDEPADGQDDGSTNTDADVTRDETDFAGDSDGERASDFARIDGLDDDYHDYMSRAQPYHRFARPDESDPKLQAIKNTPAVPESLHEYLTSQWRLVECDPKVYNAGSTIIDYIDDRGYLTTRIEQLYNKDKSDFNLDHLQRALKLVQTLEPAGIGSRDLKECLLIQLAAGGDDTAFEQTLVSEYMDKLLDNRLPQIARQMNCGIEQVNRAIERLSKLDTSPGLQIGPNRNHCVKVDVIVEQSDDSLPFSVRLADSDVPSLRISDYYSRLAADKQCSENTKKFLQNNIRSAQWIIDAIRQRRTTLLKVAEAVVRYQRDFFEKGQLYLRPLPMGTVAAEVGVHLATVSRAVAGKYIQCSWGILPLRKFFSGGTKNDAGQELSWEAIRTQLEQIIDSEDKTRPLSDAQIHKRLEQAGIKNLARRTVAKYRKLLKIPAARYRKRY